MCLNIRIYITLEFYFLGKQCCKFSYDSMARTPEVPKIAQKVLSPQAGDKKEKTKRKTKRKSRTKSKSVRNKPKRKSKSPKRNSK